MAKLIWDNIAYNLEDALDELQKLDKRMLSGDMPDEVEFQISMEHIYHHLNFAWNTRFFSIENHANMTKEQFIQWGKCPEDLKLYD
jgi:hypothetical protein